MANADSDTLEFLLMLFMASECGGGDNEEALKSGLKDISITAAKMLMDPEFPSEATQVNIGKVFEGARAYLSDKSLPQKILEMHKVLKRAKEVT